MLIDIMTSKQLKGFKVTNSNRTRTIGIACTSLDELIAKACSKFQMNVKESQLYLHDGTIVSEDDFFSTLPMQTCFVLAKKGQKIATGVDIIYNALCAVNFDTLKTGLAARDFIDDNVKKKVAMLSSLVGTSHQPRSGDSSHLSSRTDDPSWFQGLDTGAKTKEAFMRRRCSERMRGYLYKAEKDIKSHPDYPKMQRSADQAIKSIKQKLAENMNMGHYFDRSDEKSICDANGCFKCDGLWNKLNCESISDHLINPYSNREQRIVFSTWNLDHRIEKSREIIPNLIKACLKHSSDPESYEINLNYFFSLLFTTMNLRLVHIVCHDKGAHTTAKCNQNLVLIDKKSKDQKGTKRKLSTIDDLPQTSSQIKA